MDYLRDLEYLGITARIKRLNDSFSYGIKELYKANDLDIEPSWHLILLLLKNEERMKLVDIANRLHISQPAITKVVNKMIDKNYVIKTTDSLDSRAKYLSLTKKAKIAFPKWENVWNAGQQTIKKMLQNNPDFLKALTLFEDENNKHPFCENALKYLNDTSNN